MLDLRDLKAVDAYVNTPAAPGAPDPAGPTDPPSSDHVARERARLWLGDLDAADDSDLAHLADADLAAVAAARAWLDGGPAPDLGALQEAWDKLHAASRVTEAEALECFAAVAGRVGCPNCGGFQVYDLLEACWACGKPEREQRLVRVVEDGIAKSVDVPVVVDGYDIDVRVRCADPACVQWGTACSGCGGSPEPQDGLPRANRASEDDACTNCGRPWPRARTRWGTEAKGACAGKNPTSNDPDRGCGWARA